MSTALAAALTKLTGLSVGARAALGLAVAVGVIGAGPAMAAQLDEVDDTAGIVIVETGDMLDDEATEPTDTDEPTDGEDTDGEDTDGEDVDGEDVDGDAGEDVEAPPADLPEAAAFGQAVAADARDGGVDGQEISAMAHERNAARRAAEEAPDDPAEEPAEDVDPADAEDDADELADAGTQDADDVAPAGRTHRGGGRP
ncbi:MAG TPA: hypothetical protein VN257_10295 [Actinotalea sp.]|nr:hypothetical protein [Actinotalea sp.]